jgi:hypothetical protein
MPRTRRPVEADAEGAVTEDVVHGAEPVVGAADLASQHPSPASREEAAGHAGGLLFAPACSTGQ